MRLKGTEYGCSPIVRIVRISRMLLAEETFAVLGGYDMKISKSEMTGIASGPNLPSSVYVQKSRACDSSQFAYVKIFCINN